MEVSIFHENVVCNKCGESKDLIISIDGYGGKGKHPTTKDIEIDIVSAYIMSVVCKKCRTSTKTSYKYKNV